MADTRIRLSRRLVAALDVARGAAASYVVIHHVAQAYSLTAGPGLVFRFGQEAVLIFFLLSGFVIFANERERGLDTRAYFIRRFLRIYPLLLVAMAVSALVAAYQGVFLERFSWSDLVGNLFSLEDVSALKPGVIVDPFMGDTPLWSLSYEVAFYVLFPGVLRLWLKRPAATNHAIGAASVGCYLWFAWEPNHWALVGAYFLVWWCGAMAAQAYAMGGRTFLALGVPFYYLIALCVAAAAVVVRQGFVGLGVYPFLMLRHFVVAVAFIVLLYGPLGRAFSAIAIKFAAPAAFLASISYGLYVLHYPLLINWDVARTPTGFFLAFGLLVTLSVILDRMLSIALRRNRHVGESPGRLSGSPQSNT